MGHFIADWTQVCSGGNPKEYNEKKQEQRGDGTAIPPITVYFIHLLNF